MGYFPDRVMPKQLARETSAEVDGSPLVFNAFDYNRHHREIRAIEQFLIGTSGSEASGFSGYFDGSSFSAFSGFSGQSRATSGMFGVISEINSLLTRINDDGLLASLAGYVPEGGQVPIPDGVVNATIVGAIGASDTTIACPMAGLFPRRGYLTKFNSVLPVDYCVDGFSAFSGECASGDLYKDYEPFVKACEASSPIGHLTNQEFIWYEARTDDSFGPCTRGADGTTAQDLLDGEVAVIIPGRASLMLSTYGWSKETPRFSGFRQFAIGHGSDLIVYAGGFSGALDKIDDHYSVGYCVTITPNFDDVNISTAYEA